MATTSDIKKGLCMHYKHDIYIVTDFQHVKPARGPAFVRTSLKSMTNGKTVDNTFPSGHKIDVVRVERRNFQYLYKDASGFHFMNTETYEQIFLEEKMIDAHRFMKEGLDVEILFDASEEKPLTVELPQYSVVEITYTEPGEKGNTSTNAFKPATIETGAEIKVPLFINEGDKVKIETATGSYMERSKA